MVATVYSRRPLHVAVERPASGLPSMASRAAIFAVMLGAMTLLARRAGLVSYDELLLPFAVAAGSAAVALLVAAIALADCWTRGASGGWRAIRAVFVALLVALPFAFAAQRLLANPAVIDVSTDPLDPPPIGAADDQPAAAPASLSTRSYDAAIERVGSSVRTALVELGWESDIMEEVRPEGAALPGSPPVEGAIPVPRMRPLTAEEQAEVDRRLAAAREEIAAERRVAEAVTMFAVEVKSPVLGVPSDVVIRLRDDGESTRVDLRSRSRQGQHDLGENARRIAAFLAALDEVIQREGVR